MNIQVLSTIKNNYFCSFQIKHKGLITIYYAAIEKILYIKEAALMAVCITIS